jgi:hypothetical protein
MRDGITGMMIPNPITSINTVTKMNPNAAERFLLSMKIFNVG